MKDNEFTELFTGNVLTINKPSLTIVTEVTACYSYHNNLIIRIPYGSITTKLCNVKKVSGIGEKVEWRYEIYDDSDLICEVIRYRKS